MAAQEKAVEIRACSRRHNVLRNSNHRVLHATDTFSQRPTRGWISFLSPWLDEAMASDRTRSQVTRADLASIAADGAPGIAALFLINFDIRAG